jgi:exosortase
MSTIANRSVAIPRPFVFKSIFVLVVVLALFMPTWPKLVREWYVNGDYSHGFLVPLLAGYLAWRQRDRLLELEPIPSQIGLLALAATLGVYLVSIAGAVNTIARLSVPAVLGALTLYLGGWQYLKNLLVPIGYLIFMIPIPDELYQAVTAKLKLAVSLMSTEILHWIAIPIYREGNLLHLPSMTLEVANPCSGIRSLSALLAFGTVLAILLLRKRWKQGLLLASTIPIAVGTNVLRMLVTALLAHYVGPAATEGFFHESAGLMVFAVALGFMGLLTWMLSHERAQNE